ncbi:MAG: DHH family phosphoesterase [Angelakisella sp.]
MVEHIDNAIIFFHEPYASSASEMVAELVQYFKEGKLRISVAEASSAGRYYAGYQSFILRTGVRTFEDCGFPARMGADTVAVRELFASSMESYQERSRLVSAAEVYRGCAISCTSGSQCGGHPGSGSRESPMTFSGISGVAAASAAV